MLKEEWNNWLRIKILKIYIFAFNKIIIEYNFNRMNNKFIIYIYIHHSRRYILLKNLD